MSRRVRVFPGKEKRETMSWVLAFQVCALKLFHSICVKLYFAASNQIGRFIKMAKILPKEEMRFYHKFIQEFEWKISRNSFRDIPNEFSIQKPITYKWSSLRLSSLFLAVLSSISSWNLAVIWNCFQGVSTEASTKVLQKVLKFFQEFFKKFHLVFLQ